MKRQELLDAGYFDGPVVALAEEAAERLAEKGWDDDRIRGELVELGADPDGEFDEPVLEELADVVRKARTFSRGEGPAPWRQWGRDIDPEAVEQMRRAVELPISVYGALMPDAHRGYGLPIGGVLATEGAVIPYAVGMDIACRMKLSVFEMPPEAIDDDQRTLSQALEYSTSFGVGASFDNPKDHPVLDEDWSFSEVTRKLKDKARRQLGSSGSGNHFAEFGVLTVDNGELGLGEGRYLALLTHSGSRGPGATVAQHFSKVAKKKHPELPKSLNALSWLELDSPEGREYWRAMNLMGRYASANHEVMHRDMEHMLGTPVIAGVENHHNFAWKEEYGGKELIVHRKGATPAGAGTLGVVPGSMTAPAYVVRGKGSAASLNSAAHGAGRVMSRRQAKRSISWQSVKQQLEDQNVKLLSAGLDEAPDVYKDIDEVMGYQDDLVDVVATFEPRIVKMAPDR